MMLASSAPNVTALHTATITSVLVRDTATNSSARAARRRDVARRRSDRAAVVGSVGASELPERLQLRLERARELEHVRGQAMAFAAGLERVDRLRRARQRVEECDLTEHEVREVVDVGRVDLRRRAALAECGLAA